MKVLITNSQKNIYAKKELDKGFSNMYEEVHYITDSLGERKIIDYRNDDDVIMIYGEKQNVLYFCEDLEKPILHFTYTSQELKKLVGDWFSNKFELPVDKVHFVDKSQLN